MARVTAQEYLDLWAQRLKGSTEQIRKGIQRVSKAPGQSAAAAQNLMKQRLVQSIDDGTWANQVSKVSLADWQQAASGRGVDRIAAGVDAQVAKGAAMAQQLLANVDAAAAAANALPKGTIEDSVNRASTFIREMAKRKLRARR